MKFVAEINIMPLKNIFDAQGKVVEQVVQTMGYRDVRNIRIGKYITLEVTAKTKEEAMIMVNEICVKVLHSPASEGFEYEITEKE